MHLDSPTGDGQTETETGCRSAGTAAKKRLEDGWQIAFGHAGTPDLPRLRSAGRVRVAVRPALQPWRLRGCISPHCGSRSQRCGAAIPHETLTVASPSPENRTCRPCASASNRTRGRRAAPVHPFVGLDRRWPDSVHHQGAGGLHGHAGGSSACRRPGQGGRSLRVLQLPGGAITANLGGWRHRHHAVHLAPESPGRDTRWQGD